MLSALLLFLHNDYEERQAGLEAGRMLNEVRLAISEKTLASEAESGTSEVPAELLSPEMPVIVVGGYAYIGYVSVPELNLELPVMSEWDYNRLKIAPCRHFGSSRTDNLVIAAHNYDTHFGLLSELKSGAEICFTDMEGITNHYRLSRLETVAMDNVDAVLNSGFDLVLYTCTPDGARRIVAFCERVL